MLRASNINFYKIMTAGYISAEAYSMLKPKARFHELDLNGLSLKPWGIALKFLFLHHENILFPND